MLIRLALLLVLIWAPLTAAACPPPADAREARLELLIAALRNSEGPAQARSITDQIWALWFVAPDQKAQGLLDQGTKRLRWGDYGLSEKILTGLTEYCPGYAEGWNQRAFARFLKGDYEASLKDIERVLELEPRHFGALAGKVRVLLAQDRTDAARRALDAALKVHPWLAERQLLPKGEKI